MKTDEVPKKKYRPIPLEPAGIAEGTSDITLKSDTKWEKHDD